MKLLAQYPDAVAVSLHDLEAEVLTTAAREIEFMALLDPDALGAVTLSGQDLRAGGEALPDEDDGVLGDADDDGG